MAGSGQAVLRAPGKTSWITDGEGVQYQRKTRGRLSARLGAQVQTDLMAYMTQGIYDRYDRKKSRYGREN